MNEIFKKVKFPKKLSDNEYKNFLLKINFFKAKGATDKNKYKYNQLQYKEPYSPDLKDLYRLYWFIILNKRTTILELGSGYSTLIMSIALDFLNKKYPNFSLLETRRKNYFTIFVIENIKKFMKISKKRLNNFKLNKNKIHFQFSKSNMTIYNGLICTEYEKLPLCNPDFIYIDGPDQFNVNKDTNNFTTKHNDLMPMSCDILKIEFFLNPGTIILMDGRSANAEFLEKNFKRDWLRYHDKENDQNIFYLNSKSIGKYNDNLLKFYKS